LAPDRCHLYVEPEGLRLGLGLADDESLLRLLVAIEIQPAAADSMTQAFADWVDDDDSPRPGGAERAWYGAAHRPPPRNRRMRSAEELRWIRGFESVDLDGLVDADSAPVVLDRAPLVV